jgi:hypothetical protein
VSTEKTITVKAADGTLTMAELRAFVAGFDEVAVADVDQDVIKPKARVSLGGHLKSLTVKVQA